MDNFTLCLSTEYVFGRGVEERVGELTASRGAKVALVCRGHGSAVRSGLWQRVLDSLEKHGIRTVALADIDPNPTDDRVYEGIDLCRRAGVDFIVAVGGGSVIDTAKAIALGVPHTGDFWDFYSGKATPHKALPVGVVLTIPAAGSEGSGNSVITKIDGRHKISVRYPDILRPVYALMDPELTISLPWFQTACGIVDMMAHIFERYFSDTPGCDVTDGSSESLLRTIMAQARLLRAEQADYDARANIMWAGMLCHQGYAGCGRHEDWATHGLEHELSALNPAITHGAGLAVMFPAWMEYVYDANPARFAQYGREVFGLATTGALDADALSAIDETRAFFASLGMPTTLEELDVHEDDIEKMIPTLRANKGEAFGSFKKLTMEDAEEIYRSAV